MSKKSIEELDKLACKFIIGHKRLTIRQKQLINQREFIEWRIQRCNIEMKDLKETLSLIDNELSR